MYYYRNVMLLRKIIFLFLIGCLTVNSSFAFVNCQSKYDSDKRSLPSKRGSCGVCHINPTGGGPQNEFGVAFKNAGFMLTDELVAKFPNLFQKSQDEPIFPSGGSTSTSSSSSGEDKAAAPLIKRVTPKIVKVNVQSMLLIMGKNFMDGTKTIIDNNEVLTTFKSNVLLVIDFILNTVGAHELKVKNPDEQESNAVKIKGK